MKYIYSLRAAIDEIISEKNAYVIGEDIMEPYGGAFKVTKGLSEKYPNNIIGVPMSEQGFTAISVGMAMMNQYVIEEIMFGDFITLAADQLVNHAAKFFDLYGQKLHLVVRTPSGGYRGYGSTHSQSLEKMFLGIPGLNVVAPSIFIDVGKLLKETINLGKPTIFIENKLDYPKELVLENFEYFERTELNNIVRLSIKGEVPECTIITYGGISCIALEVAKKIILEEEMALDIIIVSNISDDTALSCAPLLRTNKIVFAEESTGGFGFAAQAAAGFFNKDKDIRIITSALCSIPSAELAEYEVLIQEEDLYNAIVSLI